MQAPNLGKSLDALQIQTVTIAATHADEVQTVTTAAPTIVGVQLMTTFADEGETVSGNLALHFPEWQRVRTSTLPCRVLVGLHTVCTLAMPSRGPFSLYKLRFEKGKQHF